MVSEQVKARVAAFKTKIRDWKRATRKEERQKAIQKRDGELGEQVTLWKAKKNDQAARARAAEAIAKRVDRAEERARTAEATLNGGGDPEPDKGKTWVSRSHLDSLARCALSRAL